MSTSSPRRTEHPESSNIHAVPISHRQDPPSRWVGRERGHRKMAPSLYLRKAALSNTLTKFTQRAMTTKGCQGRLQSMAPRSSSDSKAIHARVPSVRLSRHTEATPERNASSGFGERGSFTAGGVKVGESKLRGRYRFRVGSASALSKKSSKFTTLA